ncbi:MAG: GNAT family N-acetyltransferase [Fusicatenibacter sp.]|nr:GNAT family N-acetyltransferase [Lachnospiraceae bacterium]MDY2937721.1 GNAT family N-acetyltransferase [Fusicatenibacter sp.]
MHLERVTGKNVWKLVALEVREDQKNFVASNTESIIEAYTTISAGGYAFPFGIYDGDTPVGFLMIGYDVDEDWSDPPEIARKNYSIWRLMIDRKYQGRGYGREAMKLALDYIRTYPCGRAECCYLSYEPDNLCAKKLYASFGFRENGEMDGDEVVAVLSL